VARPKLEITDSAIATIEQFAGQGCTLTQIALMIDVSDSTLDRWLKHPQVKRAYERGRAIAAGEITGALYNLAKKGDVAAAIFWCKSQLGWKESGNEAIASSASVQIYLPDNGRGK
jgi:hypothetical protein